MDALREAASEGVEQLNRVLAAEHGFDREQLSEALATASWCGHPDSVRLLLHHGATITDRAVIGAANKKLVETWELLLAHGWDPNRSVVTRRQTTPPLCLAIGSESLDCLKLLLDNGADIDAVNGNGMSALELAVQHSSLEPARLLLERGAKMPPPILFYAIRPRFTNRPAMVEFLLKAGADPDPAPIDQFPTVLHKAIRYVKEDEIDETVLALIEAGADPARKVDYFDTENYSALDMAEAHRAEHPGLVEKMRAKAKTAEVV